MTTSKSEIAAAADQGDPERGTEQRDRRDVENAGARRQRDQRVAELTGALYSGDDRSGHFELYELL